MRRGLGLEHGGHLRGLGTTDGDGPGMHHGRLLVGNRLEGGAEVFDVIQADVGEGQHVAAWVDRGGIEAPAESHFEDGQVHLRFREGDKGRDGDQLKRREVVAEGQRLEPLQQVFERVFANGSVRQPDALAPAQEMGGGVKPAAQARGCGDALDHGGDGALAIGPGHLDSPEAAFWVSQFREGRFDSLQAEVDTAAAEGSDQLAEGVGDGHASRAFSSRLTARRRCRGWIVRGGTKRTTSVPAGTSSSPLSMAALTTSMALGPSA